MKSPILLNRDRNEIKPEGLERDVDHSEKEARLVLPGIQALFGFQLIVAFSTNFKTLLPQRLQNLHLIALVSIAFAVLFVLTPTAYYRRAEAWQSSRQFADIANFFLTLALVPLMIGIVLDVYVISVLVTEDYTLALTVSIVLLMAFLLLWFIFPNTVKGPRINLRL